MAVQADDKRELRKMMRRICVMVAHKNGTIVVRNSKDPSVRRSFSMKKSGVLS